MQDNYIWAVQYQDNLDTRQLQAKRKQSTQMIANPPNFQTLQHPDSLFMKAK
jgi:hypothetical protein